MRLIYIQKSVVLAILLLFNFIELQAQDDYKYKTELIPPSPNISSLGSYGGLAPNLINGAPSVNIPLVSLKVSNHDIGLALNYGSSGFKVDELAGSLGYGWSLQGVGTISRIIYDIPDERGQKVAPPTNISLNKPQFNQFLQEARSDVDYEKNTDSQPDQFSFNFMGYNGKFIFDQFMHPIFIEHTNLKISYTTEGGDINTFTVLAPDGAEYTFSEAEKTRSTPSCGIVHNQLRTTGWFLTTAKFANGEQVNFFYRRIFATYRMSVSQTAYTSGNGAVGCPGGSSCPTLSASTCLNYFDYSTVLLTNISAPSGSVNLAYTERLNAANGLSLQTKGELLQTIAVLTPDLDTVKRFSLEYQNVLSEAFSNEWTSDEEKSRPFLIKLNEKDKQNLNVRQHQFEYNALSSLAPRLSYAQDHWGYFNGQSNSSLLPKPAGFSRQHAFPTALANRSPNETYASAGLLKKVIYPTGGFEELHYEANTIYANQQVMANATTSSTAVQGTGLRTKQTNSNTISIGIDQEVKVTISVPNIDANDPNYSDYDPQHNIAFVNIDGAYNGSVNQSFSAGTNQEVILNVLNGNTLNITVEAYGSLIHAVVLVEYIPGSATWAYSNQKVGGVRVSNILSSAIVSETPVKRYFYYAKLSSLQQSSGNSGFSARYDKTVTTRLTCGFPGSYWDCQSDALYSNSLYNLFVYPTGIQYQYLTESVGGSNFEDGGIQHTYTCVPDVAPAIIRGQDMTGAPYQNNSIYSGREIETLDFNKDLLPVQKTVTEYKDDSTLQNELYGYSVTLRCALPTQINTIWPDDDEIETYNYCRNSILSRWIYKNKETVYHYDQSGGSFVIDETDYSYGNPVHALLTKTEKYDSKGIKDITIVKYPLDFAIISAKTTYQARVDFDATISGCREAYNTALNTFNTNLGPLIGRQNYILGTCYSLYKNNCSVCTFPCNNTSCWQQQDNRIAACRIDSGLNTVNSQIQSAIQNSTVEADYANCVSAALNQYNSDLTNYNTALDQAIASTVDEHTKALLVMQKRWLINSVVEKTGYQNSLSAELAKTENKYKYWPNDQVDLHYVYNSVKGNATEKRMVFDNYDGKGYLLDYQKLNDVDNSYIWDYHNQYPIAKCLGGSSMEIAYTSFEADGNGNWDIPSSARSLNLSITGKKCYDLSTGDITRSNLQIGAIYKISYWSTGGPKTIQGGAYNTKSGATKGAWTYYEHQITMSSTGVTIMGSGFIDELRLYPVRSQMTSYTYEQLVGQSSMTDAEGLITYYEYDNFNRLKNIKDYQGNIVKNFQYNYTNSCGENCAIFPMQTFNGSNTIGYPVGVFNVNGQLLGNATSQSQFLTLWNGNAADQAKGVLSAGSDNLHFQLALTTGQTPPPGITGLRYYQVDLPYHEIDNVRNFNGAYVDFGDGTGMRLGMGYDVIQPLAANTVVSYLTGRFDNNFAPHYIHTYPNNNLKTLTFYHNDAIENTEFDNNYSPASSLTLLRNLRGNVPQFMQTVTGSCYQQATMTSVANIANWSAITSVTTFGANLGDNSISNNSPWQNVGYAQDFMAANKGLTKINTSPYGPYRQSIRDVNFKLSRLKSDWNTYFTEINFLTVCEDNWNHENLSQLKKLNFFILTATTQDHTNNEVNNPIIPLDSTVIDNVIIQIAAGAGTAGVKNGTIVFNAGGAIRSANSNTAYNQLVAAGWNIVFQ